ncbi:MAG: tripartite tricarboxylate transporter substrate binding protein [Betaproteobacteria bacterium]|nr:tripartite tricarboxylate transporter substrate binding protein [Betaproteobacteria bacterium]
MLLLRCACAALLIVLALPAAPQSYPVRPVRLIVPIAPGGGPDTLSRAVGQKLGDQLGQTVVADNRPGASGAIALDLARGAAPDGYTLVTISASQVIRPLVYRVTYDLARDFAPISQLSAQSYVLMVGNSMPVKSVRELVAHAKANPGMLNYASVGQGSQIHLMTELFRSLTGIQVIHVPYKGIGAAYPDLMAGTIHFVFGGILTALAQVKAGRLRPLAVSGAKRMSALPDLPTVAEAGVPGFAVSQWYAVLAPAGTPRRLVDHLNREINRALQDPEVSRRIAAEGSEAVGSTPQQLGAHIKAERDKWEKVIKKAGIKGEL